MSEPVAPVDRRLLRRQMLADDVYEAIKTMLMDHVIRPGARISIGPGPYRFGDRIESVRKGVLLHDRATREFGYRPRYSIRAGLGAYIEHQRKI